MELAQRELLNRIFEIVSGNLAISDANKYISDDVLISIDNMTFKGVKHWKAWIRFLQNKGKVKNAKLNLLKLECQKKLIHVEAKWQGELGNTVLESDLVNSTFEIDKNCIVSIWTSKKNYEFFFGKSIRNKFSFYYLLIRIFMYSILK